MTGEILTHLQKLTIFQQIYNPDQPPAARLEAIEKDKRSQKRVIGELITQGYLGSTPNMNGNYPVTRKAYNEIELLPTLDLNAVWDRQRAKEYKHKNLQFVRVGAYGWQPPSQLTFPESRYFIDNSGRFEWFVISTEALSYNFDPSQDQFGPFTLPQASLHWNEKISQLHKFRDCEIVVSTPELRQHVIRVVFNEKAEAVFKTSLGWGLAKLGIITEEEMPMIKTDPLGGVTLMAGIGSQFGDDPEQWGEKIASNIDLSMNRMMELQRRITLMRKVERGVVKYGGWPKFLEDYRAALIDALIKQDTQKEEAASAK